MRHVLNRWFALVALAVVALAGAPAPAQAASGIVQIEIVKASAVVGVSGGDGILIFHHRRYPLHIGGVSFGASIGVSKAILVGRVFNIRRPQDIVGGYGAATASGAVVRGTKVIRLRNDRGAVLELRGGQVGLEISADLSGLSIDLR